MNNGLNIKIVMAALAAGFLATLTGSVSAEIYKVVDAQGNVTYTDQSPGPDAAPMVLPELSVVDTDYDPESEPADPAAATDGTAEDGTSEDDTSPRALRKAYQDFAITQPAQEQTFWGTENSVVISWSSEKALLPGMAVRLFIDGQAVSNTQDNMYAATLDRGEHSVYAQLMDPRGRRVMVSPTVVFYIKQHSVGTRNGP